MNKSSLNLYVMIKNDSDTSIDFEEINFAFFTLLVNRQILMI